MKKNTNKTSAKTPATKKATVNSLKVTKGDTSKDIGVKAKLAKKGGLAVSLMSVEILSHFQCKDCQGWWSIGDAVLEDKTDWFCPWCGIKNIFENFLK